jgi:nucleotide-binding universal stress UspA family protein
MKHILAAVDFSVLSEAVVRQTTEFARAFGAEVTLLHVAAPDPSFVGYGVGPKSVRAARAGELKRERTDLQRMADSLQSEGISARALLYAGSTVETLIEEAARIPADLMIVGSHARGPIARALIGSVSHGVVQRARCPVLVVPQPLVVKEAPGR